MGGPGNDANFQNFAVNLKKYKDLKTAIMYIPGQHSQ